MKALLFNCLLLLSFLGIAQTNTKVNPIPGPSILNDLVIGVPDLKNIELGRVKESLKALSGVYWQGYCEDQHNVLLQVDRSVQNKDNKEIIDAILRVKNDYKIYVKTKSIAQAVNMCIDKEKALSK
jgi:hypothetical protein